MTWERMKVSGASFRDPSGFVVEREGEFLRVVQPAYAEDYQCLFASGLYEELTGRGLLIPHEEIETRGFDGAFKVLRPRQIPFVSYPYEWCFSQLQDAALATLAIQKAALARGMMLKDAPAFNMQFLEGKPVLIDTLSFEKLRLEPWAAYGQFCRHFLAPLALISLCDARLGQLSRIHLDGVPLSLARRLLPWRGRLNFWLMVHLYWHAASEQRSGQGSEIRRQKSAGQYRLSSLQGLADSLEAAVRKLRWEPAKRAWATYYESSVTGGKYVEHKKQIVADFLKTAAPRTVWDLGANTGMFSRLAAAAGAETVSFDSDADCVEIAYLEARQKKEAHLLALWMDLTNPSPALGWEHRERLSWLERRPPEMVMALGLVHHLAIANNLPLGRIRDFCGRLGRWLAIEFVPKEDANAQKLLRVREDIFDGYTRENFEKEFSRGFTIERAVPVQDSPRVLYLMRNQEG